MRSAKVDANQDEIVNALRSMGATVQSLARVGAGCPDLLVGFRGKNYLLEVKDGRKVPSAQKLTDAQIQWHRFWRGHVQVVKTVDETLKVLELK